MPSERKQGPDRFLQEIGAEGFERLPICWHIHCLARPASEDMMKTAELTELELPTLRDQDVIHLPLGLLGFERIKDYIWIESADEVPFRWLQALHDPSLTFLVVPPFELLSSYAPNVTDEDVAFLGLSCPMDALIYAIVTLRPGGRSTMNLKGPIVVNRFTQIGKQVVLANAADYSLQCSLPVADETSF